MTTPEAVTSWGLIGDTVSRLRIKDVAGLNMSDIEKLQKRVKYFFEVEAIVEIVAAAFERIARLNLEEDKEGDEVGAGEHVE